MGLNGPYGKGDTGFKGWPRAPTWAGPTWTRRGHHPSFLLLSYYMEGLLVGLGEKEGGAAPLLVQYGPEGEGAHGLPWSPLSPLWPNKAHILTGGFR